MQFDAHFGFEGFIANITSEEAFGVDHAARVLLDVLGAIGEIAESSIAIRTLEWFDAKMTIRVHFVLILQMNRFVWFE